MFFFPFNLNKVVSYYLQQSNPLQILQQSLQCMFWNTGNRRLCHWMIVAKKHTFNWQIFKSQKQNNNKDNPSIILLIFVNMKWVVHATYLKLFSFIRSAFWVDHSAWLSCLKTIFYSNVLQPIQENPRKGVLLLSPILDEENQTWKNYTI